MKKFFLLTALLAMFAVPQFNNAFASSISKTEIESYSTEVGRTERVYINGVWYIIEYGTDGGIIRVTADINQYN